MPDIRCKGQKEPRCKTTQVQAFRHSRISKLLSFDQALVTIGLVLELALGNSYLDGLKSLFGPMVTVISILMILFE